MTTYYNDQLSAYFSDLGADKIGFADLSLAAADLNHYYGDKWQDYPYAISLAINFPRAVIDELAIAPNHTYLRYYDALNAALDRLSLFGANHLAKLGYKAYPIPASQRMGANHLLGIFSHRLAARLAGLGWIGKSCCFITPDNGPAQRFATILTDAPLICATPLSRDCGNCSACEQACPPKAILGQNWQPNQELSARLDVFACDNHLSQVRHSFGKRICGRCLAACPIGK